MANTNFNLVGLDFHAARNSLIDYLKNNTQFKDVNYDGSNISVLLDVLAYNTYQNAFYTNMVASEMFLDTAQLRDSIISHAKELNYLPRSHASSKATITVDITPSTAVQSVVIPKYTSFTARVGSNTYSFTTSGVSVVSQANSGVFSSTLDVYEGLVTTESFVLDFTDSTLRYILTNSTVDTSSVDVTVYEDGGQTQLTYTNAVGLAGVGSTSQVFWLQPANNGQYEIIFGDGVFGRRPKNGSTASVKYRACSGQLPNGASLFVTDGTIDGHANISVTTVSAAVGGDVSETVESIRFNAPRAFQVQNRAVTASDYEVLLTTQFADIQSVSVYGGEDLTPPLFGTVCISVDVADADGAPLSRKTSYANYLKDKMSLTSTLKFIDPEFTYVKVDAETYYRPAATTKTSADISALTRGAISTYNTTSLNGFKKTLYVSEIARKIVDSDSSITGADINIKLIKRLIPVLNSNGYTTTILFDNELATETGQKLTVAERHYGHTITSSEFTYGGVSCILVDDSVGALFVAAKTDGAITVLTQIGTVDYTIGLITLNQFNVSAYEGNFIEVIATPYSQHIVSLKNTILTIADIDVSTTTTEVL